MSQEHNLETITALYQRTALQFDPTLGMEFINLGQGIKYLKELSASIKYFITKRDKKQYLMIEGYDYNAYNLHPLVEDIPYLKLKDITIYRPSGLGASYKELVDYSVKEQVYLTEVVGKLAELSNFITRMATDPEQMGHVQNLRLLNPKDVETHIRGFGKLFNGREGIDHFLYHIAFRNNKETDEVCEDFSKLTAELSKFNLVTVFKMVETIDSQVNSLLDELDKDTSLPTPNKVTMKGLADNLYSMAKAVDYMSLYLAKVSETRVALIDSHARLKQIVGK